MKRVQQKLKVIFLVLVGLFLLTVFPVLRFHSEPNLNAQPSRLVKGVYHIHSRFSDGSGEVSEIMSAAEDLKLDFVILTDHGEPNRDSLGATSWWGGTLLIGGTELSLNSGHLAAFGFPAPALPLPPEPEEAIREISRLGGLTFVSHPFDRLIPWTDWRSAGYSGIEILSSYSSARSASFLSLLSFPARYLFNQKYALLQTLRYPADNMKKWDQLNASGRYSGIFALDAHGQLPLSSGIRLPFPSYRSMFSILNVYVNVDNDLVRDAEQSARIVADAIRKRHFFNVIEAIAPANGFNARFIPEADPGGVVHIGDESQWGTGKLEVDLPFGFETRIRLIRNGTVFMEKASSLKHRILFSINSPGTYRIEVFIPGNHFSAIPWIVTNPFFLGIESSDRALSNEPSPPQYFPIPLLQEARFIAEKNTASECRVNRLQEEGVGFSVDYHLVTPPEAKDGWCAASLRRKLDFSGADGISFAVRSIPAARYWMDLRCGNESSDNWFHHSFHAQTDWTSIRIPFDRFFRYSGDGDLDLSRIHALFVSITNRLAPSGTRGRLELKEIQLFQRSQNSVGRD